MKVRRRGKTIKAGRRTRTMKRARKPGWVDDTDNQRKWNGHFLKILKGDYGNSDLAISAILSDDRLSKLCATRIRSYVDKGVTLCLNEQRKARGVKRRKQLEIVIAGLRAAVYLSASRGNQELALLFGMRADEFSHELGRCKQAFATKRLGRDRDHSILYEFHSFLESELRQSVSNTTLANLVNAGYEADGNFHKEPVTEEQIRKNLTNFKRNNPFWSNEMVPRFEPLVVCRQQSSAK